MKTIYWTLLILFLATGAGLYVWGLRYPWYSVPEDEVWSLSARLESKSRDQRFREWYKELNKLETPRKSLQDAGQGFICLSFVLGVLRLTSGFPLKDAKTPRWRWTFVAIYLATLAAQVPASIFYYGQRQARHDYPTWGDSIVIGIAQTAMLAIVFAAIGCLILWPFLAKSKFPTDLYAWPKNQTRFNLIVTIGFGLFTTLCLYSLPHDVMDGGIGAIIMAVVLTYLFLSLRAGLVTRNSEQWAGACWRPADGSPLRKALKFGMRKES